MRNDSSSHLHSSRLTIMDVSHAQLEEIGIKFPACARSFAKPSLGEMIAYSRNERGIIVEKGITLHPISFRVQDRPRSCQPEPTIAAILFRLSLIPVVLSVGTHCQNSARGLGKLSPVAVPFIAIPVYTYIHTYIYTRFSQRADETNARENLGILRQALETIDKRLGTTR